MSLFPSERQTNKQKIYGLKSSLRRSQAYSNTLEELLQSAREYVAFGHTMASMASDASIKDQRAAELLTKIDDVLKEREERMKYALSEEAQALEALEDLQDLFGNKGFLGEDDL